MSIYFGFQNFAKKTQSCRFVVQNSQRNRFKETRAVITIMITSNYNVKLLKDGIIKKTKLKSLRSL